MKISKKKVLLIIVLLLAAILIFFIVKKDRQKANISKIFQNELALIKDTMSIQIYRYDQVLFKADKNNLEKAVETIYKDVPDILIGKDFWNDTYMMSKLREYLEDPAILEIYNTTQKKYPNLKDIELQLNDALSIYKYYFPEYEIPKFYALVPGIDLNAPLVYGYGNDIFINLDLFLGADFKFYEKIGVPKYISARFAKQYMVIDIFKSALVYRHLPQKELKSVLDYMISEGKKLYFTQMMLPDTAAANIIGYTKEEYDWSIKYQYDVWVALVSKEYLFSVRHKDIAMLIEENPYTKLFGNNSPGRIGTFIGWQIVNAYMTNNADVTIYDLLKDTDYENILNLSKYKPKKN